MTIKNMALAEESSNMTRKRMTLDPTWPLITKENNYILPGKCMWSFETMFRLIWEYFDFATGALHRISSRVNLAEWFGLRSHSGRNQKTMLGLVILSRLLCACVCSILPKWIRPLTWAGQMKMALHQLTNISKAHKTKKEITNVRGIRVAFLN